MNSVYANLALGGAGVKKKAGIAGTPMIFKEFISNSRLLIQEVQNCSLRSMIGFRGRPNSTLV
jgi:hypothetical protein